MSVANGCETIMASWILGALMGLLSFFGLLVASRSVDAMFSLFGYLLFLFGVVMIFSLIAQNTGRPPEEGGERSRS